MEKILLPSSTVFSEKYPCSIFHRLCQLEKLIPSSFIETPKIKILHHPPPLLVVENTTVFSMVSPEKTCSVVCHLFQPRHIVLATGTTTTVQCYWYTTLFFQSPYNHPVIFTVPFFSSLHGHVWALEKILKRAPKVPLLVI
jgi:hypothetical protein